MNIDIKVTIWERLKLDKDQEKKVRKALKDGILNSETDLAELGVEGSWETLYETEEILDPDDNHGKATLEVWENEDDDKPLFINGM